MMEIDSTLIALVIAEIVPVFVLFFVRPTIWFEKKHLVHRIGGCIFLIQYIISWYALTYHYDWYKNSPLTVTLQLNGLMQALSAVFTFTFLTKLRKEDPGYFGDRGTITHDFVTENVFYQLMTLFGFIYYFSTGFELLTTTLVGQIIEALFVFLPFVILRPYFPKTHFRDALKNDTGKTEKNSTFYFFGTYIIKLFYIASKHYMGYLINYIRFINGFNINQQKALHWMVLANAGTVSIAVFLHTLRFKKYLNPKLSYSTYVVMAYAPYSGFVALAPALIEHWNLILIATFGVFINFGNRFIQNSFQILLCILFFMYRYNIYQVQDYISL